MLARERLLHRLLHPSLLEHPSSRTSTWKEAIRSAGSGVPLRCSLDCDPHLRLSPTKLHQVRSRHMSWELHRGGRLPRSSFHFRSGLSRTRASWGICFILVPRDPNPPRRHLGHRHHSEEKRNLAIQRALQTKVRQGLVSWCRAPPEGSVALNPAHHAGGQS